MLNLKKAHGLPQWLLAVVVTALVTAVFLVISFIAMFGVDPSESQESWGQFGDFVGGILNPLFSIIGLLALLHTIVLQSKELSRSTKELKASAKALKRQNKHNARQQFDNNFFQLLSMNVSQANAVVWDSVSNITGESAFRAAADSFSKGWDVDTADGNTWLRQFDLWHAGGAHVFDKFIHSLSNTIDFVCESDVSDDAKKFAHISISSNLSSEALTVYLLFATLSNHHCWVRNLLEEIAFFDYCQMDYLNYQPIWNEIGQLTRVEFSSTSS